MPSRELNDNAPLAVRLRHWGNHGAQSARSFAAGASCPKNLRWTISFGVFWS